MYIRGSLAGEAGEQVSGGHTAGPGAASHTGSEACHCRVERVVTYADIKGQES